jgi:hypothetical protein
MTATLSLFRPSILDPAPEPSVSDEIRAARLSPTLGDRLLAERRAAAPVATPEARSGAVRDDLRAAPAPAVATPGVAAPPADGEPGASFLGASLDDLLVGVWEDLTTHRTAACPACGDDMSPRYSAGSAPVGGRCTSCGTTIS